MRNSGPASCLQNDAVYVSFASFDVVFARCFRSVRALASGAVGYRRDKGKFCELPRTLFVNTEKQTNWVTNKNAHVVSKYGVIL